jgi:hypothetical protein
MNYPVEMGSGEIMYIEIGSAIQSCYGRGKYAHRERGDVINLLSFSFSE